MQREFFNAAGARLFSVVSALAAGLLSLKLYGHYFTPQAYGIVVVSLQIISYLPMMDGGFRTATNRSLLAENAETERRSLVNFSQTIYSWLLLALLFAGGVVLGTYGLLRSSESDFSPQFFVILGLVGALSVFSNAQAGLLIGIGHQAAMAIIGGVSSLAGVGVLALALFVGQGAWAFVTSLGSSAATTYILARLLLSTQPLPTPWLRFSGSPDFWRHFHSLRHDAWRAFRAQVSILLLFSSDLVLVAIFCSPTDTAIYGVLSRMFGIARGFLQSFSEAAWPLVARRAEGIERFQSWLLRTNGWLYGLAGAGMLFATPLFTRWYMGAAWVPSPILVTLFVARFLIIGASTPASYFLLGAGDFRSIARCCEREVVLALILGAVLGSVLHSPGVALAFLLATNAGTFLPMWVIYARRQKVPLTAILFQTWVRILASFGSFSLLWWAAFRFLAK